MNTAHPPLGRKKILFTVGTKLIGLLAMVLLSSIASLLWLSTQLFIEDNTALIQQMNADTATHLASQVREQFESITEKMRILSTVLLDENTSEKTALIQDFFSKDKDFLAVLIQKKNTGGEQPVSIVGRALAPTLAEMEDPRGEKIITSLAEAKEITLEEVFKGEVLIFTLQLSDNSSSLVLAVPLIQGNNGFSHISLAVIRHSKFIKNFGESDIVTSFMVDRQGTLITHTDTNRVLTQENVGYLEIVKKLLEGKFNNGQTRYIDPQTKEARLGAFRTVGFGGLGVVAEVAEAKAFEAAKKVVFRSMLAALIILCLSFLAGYLFSGTITWPIKQLAEAAHRISEGDFNIHLKPKGKDEVAQLSLAFNEMAKGLEERDRVKEVFNKFHNKEIAEKLLTGEVKLGGERREAVVFFSDVRGFTALSESMEPEAVVEMLNEYMTRMVAVIRSYQGVVDKYVGDAIMALWGVPVQQPEDTYRAVRACLAMREELAKLNELRILRGQGVLKIGMGLNIGQVIAGNIGSNEKMEYTVIGDSVNLASRIESMTKTYGTDLLISKSIFEKVGDRFVTKACASAKVKGKSSAIEVYKVVGFLDESNQPVLVETPYSSYAAEKSDKVISEDHVSKESQLKLPPQFRPSIGPIPPPFKMAKFLKNHVPHHTPPSFRKATSPPPFQKKEAA